MNDTDLSRALEEFPDGLAFDKENSGQIGPGYQLVDEIGYPVKVAVCPERHAFSGPVEGGWEAAERVARALVVIFNAAREVNPLREAAEGYRRAFGHLYQNFCGACGAVEDGESTTCPVHPIGRCSDQCGKCGLLERDEIHIQPDWIPLPGSLIMEGE